MKRVVGAILVGVAAGTPGCVTVYWVDCQLPPVLNPSEPGLSVAVSGILTEDPESGESVFQDLTHVTVGGDPIPPDVAAFDLICTVEPLLIDIQEGFQDFHVLFGPNNLDEAPACGWIESHPAAFVLQGSWGFFWGTLPRLQSRWVQIDVPAGSDVADTTGVLQVLATEVERVFLIDPATGGKIVVSCDLPGSTASETLDSTSEFLEIKGIDSDDDALADNCNIERLNVATDLTAEERQLLEDWKSKAAKVGWMPATSTVPP